MMDDKQSFSGSYTIRVGDINYGGHMGNDKSLLLFHDARIHFLGQHGFSESNIGGPGLIMADAHVFFKKELFLGDEVSIYIQATDVTTVSFILQYRVLRNNEEVLSGNTKMISFDYEKRKICRIPEAFRSAIM